MYIICLIFVSIWYALKMYNGRLLQYIKYILNCDINVYMYNQLDMYILKKYLAKIISYSLFMSVRCRPNKLACIPR